MMSQIAAATVPLLNGPVVAYSDYQMQSLHANAHTHADVEKSTRDIANVLKACRYQALK